MAAVWIDTERQGKSADSGASRLGSEKLTEYFWFTVCLALFLIMGPFSAPIALLFMFSSSSLAGKIEEPASAGDWCP